jgi:hypothetical protein
MTHIRIRASFGGNIPRMSKILPFRMTPSYFKQHVYFEVPSRIVYLAFSPNSTRRRMASESDGVSGWFSAHLMIAARVAESHRCPCDGIDPPKTTARWPNPHQRPS